MPLTGEYVPSPYAPVREQVELYERSGGREGGTLQGRPVVVMWTLGARSGSIRKTPLSRVEHDGRYAVMASAAGAPKHPVWYHNLLAHPLVELQDGPVRRDFTAREVDGEERETWRRRVLDVWPALTEYEARAPRVIPLLVLTPVD